MPAAIRTAIEACEASLVSRPWAWPNWVLGNHDEHRVASRLGAVLALPAAVPWLPIATDHALRNVEMKQPDEGSMLAFTRALLHLRQGSAALSIGSYTPIDVRDDRVLAYQRSSGDEHIVCVLNLSAQIVMLDVPGEILLRTSADAVLRDTDGSLVLAGNASAVLRPSGPTA